MFPNFAFQSHRDVYCSLERVSTGTISLIVGIIHRPRKHPNESIVLDEVTSSINFSTVISSGFLRIFLPHLSLNETNEEILHMRRFAPTQFHSPFEITLFLLSHSFHNLFQNCFELGILHPLKKDTSLSWSLILRLWISFFLQLNEY